MLKIVLSNQFKRDLKSAAKRKKDIAALGRVVQMLANEEPIPNEYYDHSLTGQYRGFRECHIEPDWLLVYRIEKEELELFLFRTGSHSDLFK